MKCTLNMARKTSDPTLKKLQVSSIIRDTGLQQPEELRVDEALKLLGTQHTRFVTPCDD